jgi:hypothetical protein
VYALVGVLLNTVVTLPGTYPSTSGVIPLFAFFLTVYTVAVYFWFVVQKKGR